LSKQLGLAGVEGVPPPTHSIIIAKAKGRRNAKACPIATAPKTGVPAI